MAASARRRAALWEGATILAVQQCERLFAPWNMWLKATVHPQGSQRLPKSIAGYLPGC